MKKKVIYVTNYSSENNFADVSTECSSRYQGESEGGANKTSLFIATLLRGMMEKSAVAEHEWENHHPIDWEETTVLDRGRGQELLLKEALHIQMTPSEERFNRDGGLEVPGCWIAVMRRQGGRSNPHRPLTSDDVYPQ